jgi:hypothetical protein
LQASQTKAATGRRTPKRTYSLELVFQQPAKRLISKLRQ